MRLYHHLTQCRFLYRVNRFIAYCEVDGASTPVHVKNTGRLRELLVPGAAAYVENCDGPGRKTAWDLVAVEKDGAMVNIDSVAPNAVCREWVENGGWADDVAELRAEVPYGDSRFDLAYRRHGKSALLEVKGVTLLDAAGVAYFPDAPTQRGVKHLEGLARAARAGLEAGVCFVLMAERAVCLRPNVAADPAFARALRAAAEAGVRLEALVCRVTPEECTAVGSAPVLLDAARPPVRGG